VALLTVEQRLAEGDLVALHWTVHAAHQDDFMGIPPTG
jgi:predicted ester cyclase